MALTVSFYQLAFDPVEKIIPKLVDGMTKAGIKSVIMASDTEMMNKINASMWTFSTLAFVPHGTREDSLDIIDELPNFLTTTLENPITASACIVCNEEIIFKNANTFGFERILYIFDGTSSQATQMLHERMHYHQSCNDQMTIWHQTKAGWAKIEHQPAAA